MKQYPYIGQRYNAIVLFYAAGKGLLIDDALGFDGGSKAGDEVRLYDGTNITREYLQNTWGVVESKEHVEFIIELAELHGFSIWGDKLLSKVTMFRFVFVHGELMLHSHDCKGLISEFNLKQITIPLPPKSDINEAGHNLVFAASECKEWPCINDEVTWGDLTHKGVVKSISDGFAWIKRDSGEYETVYISSLKKPKTPEEVLRDDIIELTLSNMENKSHPIEANAYYLFSELLTKYNITPKD